MTAPVSQAAPDPSPSSPQDVLVPQKKGLWRGRSRLEKGAWVFLAVVVAVVVAAAATPTDDSGSTSANVVDNTTASESASNAAQDAISGKVEGVFHRDCFFCGDLKQFVDTSNAWCGWKDDTLVVHVTMTNNSVEHITVNWHPSYVIRGGTEHGAGLTSVQSDGFDAGETRELLAEQHPKGVTPGAAIGECKPSFSVIQSG